MTAAEFHEKNGDHVEVNGWIYYETGAKSEGTPWGGMWNPPTKREQLLKNQLVYHKAKYERACREFEDFKSGLAVLLSNNLKQPTCPLPRFSPEELEEKLATMRSKIRRLKANVASVEAELNPHDPEKERQLAELAEADQISRARNQAVLDTLNKFKL